MFSHSNTQPTSPGLPLFACPFTPAPDTTPPAYIHGPVNIKLPAFIDDGHVMIERPAQPIDDGPSTIPVLSIVWSGVNTYTIQTATDHSLQLNDDVDLWDNNTIVSTGTVSKVIGNSLIHVLFDHTPPETASAISLRFFNSPIESVPLDSSITFLGIQGQHQPRIQPYAYRRVFLTACILSGPAEIYMHADELDQFCPGDTVFMTISVPTATASQIHSANPPRHSGVLSTISYSPTPMLSTSFSIGCYIERRQHPSHETALIALSTCQKHV